MARIDSAALRATAALAQLELSDGDLERLRVRLVGVLAHFAALDEVDTTDVEPALYPLPAYLLPASGPPGPPLAQAEVLANAPVSRDGAFVVPRMVDR